MARWIKCKTRMPKPPKGQDFAPVLFFVPRLGNNGVCAGRYFPNQHGTEFESLQRAQFSAARVTHWMPMPPRPSSSAS